MLGLNAGLLKELTGFLKRKRMKMIKATQFCDKWDLAINLGFPGGSDSKESTCNAGDLGLTPGWGRHPEERNGNPLQYSCLENFMNRGEWKATAHGIPESWTRLSH